MNLIEIFQDLVAKVPEFVQPIIIAAAGAVPFIEGEGAVSIGIVGGVNPVVSAIAAILGSFTCVFIVVHLSARARQAIVTRRNRSRVPVTVGGGAPDDVQEAATAEADQVTPESGRRAARRAKFQRAFDRYGVPGVSLLGPLLLPPVFTASMLIAAGVGKSRVLIWQAIGIVLWVIAFALLFHTAVTTMH